MGATPLMSLGMRAMAANYAALQVTGHNIANASVQGYSRQRVETATAAALAEVEARFAEPLPPVPAEPEKVFRGKVKLEAEPAL